MPPGRKERGRHSLSFLNRSDHFSHSLLFVWGPGLVRFLLLSTQFSVFVRDHLRRKDRYKFSGGWRIRSNSYIVLIFPAFVWCPQPANTRPQVTLLWLNKPVFLNARESGIGEKPWTAFLGYQGYGAWLGNSVLSERNLLTPAFDNNGNSWSDVNVQITRWRWNYYNGQISMVRYRFPSPASVLTIEFLLSLLAWLRRQDGNVQRRVENGRGCGVLLWKNNGKSWILIKCTNSRIRLASGVNFYCYRDSNPFSFKRKKLPSLVQINVSYDKNMGFPTRSVL